jgi:hypothetical protein
MIWQAGQVAQSSSSIVPALPLLPLLLARLLWQQLLAAADNRGWSFQRIVVEFLADFLLTAFPSDVRATTLLTHCRDRPYAELTQTPNHSGVDSVETSLRLASHRLHSPTDVNAISMQSDGRIPSIPGP